MMNKMHHSPAPQREKIEKIDGVTFGRNSVSMNGKFSGSIQYNGGNYATIDGRRVRVK
ncbi:hypothetical protein KGV52_01780 [Candidatus Gracilibacteria bacterium]|nr:hypothetical protein [Candidatus Gracilibacteria bacterium]